MDSDEKEDAELQVAMQLRLTQSSPGKLLSQEGYVVVPAIDSVCPDLIWWSVVQELYERTTFNSFVSSNGKCEL
jgi:hypothetical protein